MNNILIIGSSYPTPQAGGSINYVYNLLSGKKVEDIKVYILTADNNKQLNQTFDKSNPFTVIRSKYFYHILDRDRGGILKKRLFLILQIIISIYYILKLKPKLILYTEFSLVCASWNIISPFLRIKIGLFTYAEEIILYKKRYIHNYLLKKILKRSEIVFTVCDYTKNVLVNMGCNESVIRIIIPPVAFNTSLLEKKNDNSIFNILTVGRLEERKGQALVIKAISHLISQHPQIRYNIIGDGPIKSQLEELIINLNLEEKVKLLGRVNDDILSKYYQISDLFVMPHRELPNGDTEGCPTVFLESSYYYIPNIGGNAGGVSNAILDGRTGFIITPDENSISNSIERLLLNSQERIRMGEEGHKYSSRFTKANQSEKFYMIIRNILTTTR